jgi:Fur family iron response transcriptional regulator
MNNLNIYKEKLRESGLRPTRQRLKICEALFSPKKTFHFTINDLSKIIEEKLDEKISLATVYNTVHAFKKNGYLKEIVIAILIKAILILTQVNIPNFLKIKKKK